MDNSFQRGYAVKILALVLQSDGASARTHLTGYDNNTSCDESEGKEHQKSLP